MEPNKGHSKWHKGQAPHERFGKVNNRQIMFLTEVEMPVFFRTLNRLRDNAAWAERIFWARTLVCLGSRIEETTRILIADIGEKYLITRNGKGGKDGEKEWFPCYRPHLKWWAELRKRQGEAYLFPKIQEHLAMRVSKIRHIRLNQHPAMSVRTGRNWWHEVLAEAGLRQLPPHAARHTFATWAAEKLQKQDLQDQLNHNDWRTTDRYYRGSLPGRRFIKDKPEWEEIAEKEAKIVQEILDRKLRVVK